MLVTRTNGINTDDKRREQAGLPKLCLQQQNHEEWKDTLGACTNAFLKGCKGGLTTDVPMGNPKNIKPHISTCTPSAASVEVAKFRQQQRDTARQNPGIKTHDLMTTGLMNLSNNALLDLPQTSTMKRDLQRQKASTRPQEPQSLLDINIVHPWNTTGGANPRPFLIHDGGLLAGPNRIIVYAADSTLRHLAQSDTWYLDGNFKSAPDIYEQVYVIRSKLDDGEISNVYVRFSRASNLHITKSCLQWYSNVCKLSVSR